MSVAPHLWVDEASIVTAYAVAHARLRIYIYPTREKVDARSRLGGDGTGLDHTSLVDRLRASPMATLNASAAHFFVMQHWRDLRWVRQGPLFARGPPRTRDHIMPYGGTEPAYCADQLAWIAPAEWDRLHLLEYNGRRDCGGLCHVSYVCCRGCFSTKATIVVPVPIPSLMYPVRPRTANHTSTVAMDLQRDRADRMLQTERALVIGYIERGLYSLRWSSPVYTPAAIERRAGLYTSSYGVHAAGFGIWSARLYAYLLAGVVPLLFSDGVILPFERVLRYEAAVVKLRASTYVADDHSPLEVLRDIEIERLRDGVRTGAFARLRRGGRALGPWVDWRSTDWLRNPITLLAVELLCRSDLSADAQLCVQPTSRVAFTQLLPEPLRPSQRETRWGYTPASAVRRPAPSRPSTDPFVPSDEDA